MSIIIKMAEHITALLGTLPFDYIDASGENAQGYSNLEEYMSNDNYFWINLTTIESNKYSAANILTTFLEDNDNYQLFLKDYYKLKLSAIKYDYQYISYYLNNKEKLIHFLQHADLSINNNSHYWKDEVLKEVIDKLCVGNLDENKFIIKNFLETNKKFLKSMKVKIFLKTLLEEKFNEDVQFFIEYYNPQSKKESLILDLEDTKTICSFLDKKYLLSHYPLKESKDIKDYLNMLKQIADVIKKEFKLIDLKITQYNINNYSIIALAKKDFTYNLDNLWTPMVEQYLTLDASNSKEDLTKFLKTFLLYEHINSHVQNKEDTKIVAKKLKI